MKDELQTYMDRPKRYENIDGTGEMCLGLMMLGFALSGYLNIILPDTRWWNGIGGVLVMFAALTPALGLAKWGSKAIKKHVTWPRTGYVAFDRDGKTGRIAAAKVLLIAAAVGAISVCLLPLARRHGAMGLLGIGILASFVAGYAFWVFWLGREHRWKWLVLLIMALGLLAIGLPVGGDYFKVSPQVALFVGLVWLGSGAATLYSYLRHTQAPASESE